MLGDGTFAAWQPLVAALSLTLAVGPRGSIVRGVDLPTLPPLALAALARSVVVAWLLGAVLARDAEVRLLSAMFLASSPGVPQREVAVCLFLWLAHLALSSQIPGSCAWAPAMLFLQGLFCGPRGAGGDAPDRPDFRSGPPDFRRRSNSDLQLQPQPEVMDVVKQFPNWTPPTQKEMRAWKEAFNLDGHLFAAYACAVPSSLLLYQGYLYLSQRHVCFRGVAIVTKTLQFTVALEDVKEIRNGGSRDAATLVLRQPLQIRGRQQGTLSVDLRGCEAGGVAIAALLAKAGGGDLEDELEDFDDGDPDCDGPPRGTLSRANSSKSAASAALAAFAADEPFRSLLEVHIPRLRLRAIVDELLVDDCLEGSLFSDYFGMQSATEVGVTPWIEDAGVGDSTPLPVSGVSAVKIREVTMKVPVPPAPMCPRKTKLTTTYCLTALPTRGDVSITLQSSSVSHDVPFGDKFLVQERVELTPSEDGSGVRVHKQGRCVFLKSCGLLQSHIQASSAAQMTKTGEYLVTLLKRRAQPQDVARSPGVSDKATCTVHIWELQRRTTIWSQTWYPPFLPHDGRKRWRWVDTSYQKHPWTTAPGHEDAAESSAPPVEPQQGWVPLGDWMPSPDMPGDCDAEGWQYAIDFYRDSRFWGSDKFGLHCRRRLWIRSFVDKDGRVDPEFPAVSQPVSVAGAAMCCLSVRDFKS